MTAYRPQANFVMCRLQASGPSAPDLAKRLFVEHDILVKHLAGKHMANGDHYLRLASKTESENHVLIDALRQCLTS